MGAGDDRVEHGYGPPWCGHLSWDGGRMTGYRGAPPVEDECPECGGKKLHENWCSAYDGSEPLRVTAKDEGKHSDGESDGG
jgi:hypothetical protein